jgi:hypothetical protein
MRVEAMTPEELKAEFEKIHARIDAGAAAGITAVKTAAPWKLYLVDAVLLCVTGYLAWSLWGHKPPPAGSVTISVPQVDTLEEMETTTTTTTLTIYKDKPAAVAALGLPASEAANPKEGLLTANEVEANKNGAVVTTFVNMSTGRPRTDIQYNKAPWFALQRGNTIGVGYELGSQGAKVPVYYKRDVLRIKDIHGIVEVGGKLALDPAYNSEAYGKAGVEWRF